MLAAANCETVFSTACKFAEEAKNVGDKLLERMVKLHYNWKYAFLRPPTEEEVIARYKSKWPGAFTAAAKVSATASSTDNAPTAADAPTAAE